MNNLLGGLSSSAVSFAMTGNATFNLANIKGTGILELTVGKDGIKSRIGTNGTDISAQTIVGAMSGIKNTYKNIQINKTDYNKTTKDSLRVQWGFGDNTAKNQLEEIIKGETILKFDANNTEIAQSVTANKQKIIHINPTTNNDFIDLGLALQHEAHRDGIISNKQTQFIETANAVASHTQMALTIARDALYANKMLSYIYSDTNLQNDINAYLYAAQTNNIESYGNYIASNYNSSADYWKLKMYADGTHKLLFDGKKELSIEYLNEIEEIISTSILDNQDMSDVGMAGSLGKILGVERAEKLLGSSYLNADNYDFSTLKDVLNLSDNQISKIQRKGSLTGIELTESQKYSLVGEAIMKNSGASWNGSSWMNTAAISTTITDGIVNGNIMAEIQDSKYLYSTVNATLFRDPKSWNSVTSADGINWNRNTENYGLDSILYEKQGINYDYYDSLLLDKYQTVDNLTQGSQNQSFFSSINWLQGNTIISNNFNIQYYTKSQYLNDVLIINNANTLGTPLYKNYIGNEGNHYKGESRWLVHDNTKIENNNITYYPYQYSDGCFVTTYQNQELLLNKLQIWNLSKGYQINTYLLNESYYKTPYGQRNR